jgi:hypothetical protein
VRRLLDPTTDLFYNVNFPLIAPCSTLRSVIFHLPAFQRFSFQLLRVAGLYFAGDYNLRGRTPKADVDVCFTP